MIYTYYFEKLDVWNNSRKLVVKIYAVTRKFPIHERFKIIDQIHRSVVSVPTNLAEGSSRGTKKDQAKYTTISYSSLMELLNLLIISNDLKFKSDNDLDNLRGDIQKIFRQLNGLRKSQQQ